MLISRKNGEGSLEIILEIKFKFCFLFEMLLSIYSDIHSQDVLLLYMYVVRNIGRFPGFFQNF